MEVARDLRSTGIGRLAFCLVLDSGLGTELQYMDRAVTEGEILNTGDRRQLPHPSQSRTALLPDILVAAVLHRTSSTLSRYRE
jgi:hypothetical protein